MNWEAIGAVGSLGGALGVIATLLYLAKEIRQNSQSLNRANEFAQATSVSEMGALFEPIFASISNDPQFAAIYLKALDGEPLDAVESVQFSAWVNRFLSWTESTFVQLRLSLGFGAYSEQAARDVLRPYLARLMAVAAVQRWWQREGRRLYSEEIIEYVDGLIDEHESDVPA